MSKNIEGDDEQKEWDTRLAALEHELGKSQEEFARSPFFLFAGPGVTVLTFKEHIDGFAYVTAGLIGDDNQKKNTLGQYELMLCFRSENDWASPLLSLLGPYTLDVVLNPGETIDVGSELPDGSAITSLLLVSYRHFKVNDSDAGILLGIGITDSELEQCRTHGSDTVLALLKENGVFPFTDTQRTSLV